MIYYLDLLVENYYGATTMARYFHVPMMFVQLFNNNTSLATQPIPGL